MKNTEMHFRFLDQLRDSGETNMFGATPYLRGAFPSMSRDDATQVLTAWMRTFDGKTPVAQRVINANAEAGATS